MWRSQIQLLSLVPYPVFPVRNGGHRAIVTFLEYLSREIDVHVYTVKANHPDNAVGYTMDNSMSNAFVRYGDIRLVSKLEKIIREKKITHFMIEHPYFGWLGSILQSRTGVKFIVRSHNIEGLRWYSMKKWWWRYMMKYEKWVHQQAAFSFFITPEDEAIARIEYDIPKSKCEVITYGTTQQEVPSPAERAAYRARLVAQHTGDPQAKILLFAGSYDYAPNVEALCMLVNEIMPQLRQHNRKYHLLICGSHLAEAVAAQQLPTGSDISYLGFVERIEDYYKGADIFLNPIQSGGGIKTKLVEALSFGASAVTTYMGSTGVPDYFTGSAMINVDNDDPDAFAQAVFDHTEMKVSQMFFNHFYWGTLADRASTALQNC